MRKHTVAGTLAFYAAALLLFMLLVTLVHRSTTRRRLVIRFEPTSLVRPPSKKVIGDF